MSVLQLDEFKTRQRATWEGGDYSACSPYIAEVGELVVAHAGITPGMRVLDVACGTGHAALPAARAGARVSGLDLAAKLLEAGRAKARAEGLEIEWREGTPRIREALRPGGVFLMVDIAASSRLEGNLDSPLAPFLFTVSTMHCMTVSLAAGGEGLGACWGEEKARELLAEAGFTSVEVSSVAGDPLNAYYVCQL